jgi:uncharacterized protein (TIGR03382 family)
VNDQDGFTVAFGPVGLAGWALLLLGILFRRRVLSLLGLAGVVADVTVAELGGFKAMNEGRPGAEASAAAPEAPADVAGA